MYLFSELTPLLPGDSDEAGRKNNEGGTLRQRAMWLAAGMAMET